MQSMLHDIRFRLWIAIAVCVGTSAVVDGQTTRSDSQLGQTMTGRVLQIGDEALVVTAQDSRRLTFFIYPETQIRLNGEVAELDDLKAGDVVRIKASPRDWRIAWEVVAARVSGHDDRVERRTAGSQPNRAQAESNANGRQAEQQNNASSIALGVIVVPTPDESLLVIQVPEQGPAARAGLRPGDFVTAIDGRKLPQIDRPVELAQLARQRQPGRPVRVTLWRTGERQTVEVTAVDRTELEQLVAQAEQHRQNKRPDEQDGRTWTARIQLPADSRQPVILNSGDTLIVTVGDLQPEETESMPGPRFRQDAEEEDGESPQRTEVDHHPTMEELETVIRQLQERINVLQNEVRSLRQE